MKTLKILALLVPIIVPSVCAVAWAAAKGATADAAMSAIVRLEGAVGRLEKAVARLEAK